MKDLNKQNISKVAFELLYENGISKVPVDVINLAKGIGISVVKYSSLNAVALNNLLELEDDYDAIGIYDEVNGEEKYTIYYDDLLAPEEIRIGIAREIGQYIFDLDQGKYPEEKRLEIENIFIQNLLIPSASLFFVKELTVDKVSEVYGVNNEIAKNSIKDFKFRLTKYGPRFYSYEMESFIENM